MRIFLKGTIVDLSHELECCSTYSTHPCSTPLQHLQHPPPCNIYSTPPAAPTAPPCSTYSTPPLQHLQHTHPAAPTAPPPPCSIYSTHTLQHLQHPPCSTYSTPLQHLQHPPPPRQHLQHTPVQHPPCFRVWFRQHSPLIIFRLGKQLDICLYFNSCTTES